MSARALSGRERTKWWESPPRAWGMGAYHIGPHNPCKVAPAYILCCGLLTLPGVVGGEMIRMRSLQSDPLPPMAILPILNLRRAPLLPLDLVLHFL